MRVIIVGGGWSGLAAAVELSQQPCELQIFEAAAVLGGRARSVHWQGIDVDNGQHLMLGAYRQMLALMQQLGIDADAVFSRQAIDLSIFDPQHKLLKISSRGVLPAALNRLFFPIIQAVIIPPALPPVTYNSLLSTIPFLTR